MTTLPETAGRQIEEPSRLIRIASMARSMLAEARETPCDAAGCERFLEIYELTLGELNTILPSDLRSELTNLTLTFNDSSPSPSELRIAQAELVGWLEGLFNGLAAAAVSGETTTDEVLIAIADLPGQYL